MTEAALASADAPHAPRSSSSCSPSWASPAAGRRQRGAACRPPGQAVLLDDAVGTLLVLFPQSQLLDLARLTELTGRKLLAVEPERLERNARQARVAPPAGVAA